MPFIGSGAYALNPVNAVRRYDFGTATVDALAQGGTLDVSVQASGLSRFSIAGQRTVVVAGADFIIDVSFSTGATIILIDTFTWVGTDETFYEEYIGSPLAFIVSAANQDAVARQIALLASAVT